MQKTQTQSQKNIDLTGLSKKHALTLLKKYGPNSLPSKKTTSYTTLLLSQFKSPLIYILIIAAIITFLLGDYSDTLVILLAVGVNTFLGFWQELKAEQALSALLSILTPSTRVIRNSKVQKIDINNLVPGDIVLLGQGDKIPADGILLEAVSLTINEAVLTGESMPVVKDHSTKENVVYMGTSVLSGRAKFEVTDTGLKTQIGKIAQELTSIEQEKTPLQKKLNTLASVITVIVLSVCVSLIFLGVLFGTPIFVMFTTSVAIAVSAIPEGMVIALTAILAVGMQRIMKKKALVRKLTAAETLGSVTVIATDKTGTLTEGNMKVNKTYLTDDKNAILTAIIANNLEDPIDFALWEWVKNKGHNPQEIIDQNPRKNEKLFSSQDKYMSVTTSTHTYTKGAPEILLKMCKGKLNKREWTKNIENFTSSGLRVIGLCVDNRWLGIVGIEDPIRKDVAEVFEKTTQAGMRIVMLTGDYVGTASSVWNKISKKKAEAIDGDSISKLDKSGFKKAVLSHDVFARVTPSQKLEIVKVLQANGEVVALLGDGVNDAPAIKQADVGIVVGEASDVAKETADMVLLDSSFKTIVSAVEEGRGIYQNIKKVILYLLSDSFSEVALISISVIIGLPLPLLASQILWINLLTDGLPSIALTAEQYSKDLLKRMPIKSTQSLIDNNMKITIMSVSLIKAIFAIVIFTLVLVNSNLIYARTMTFTYMAISSYILLFSLRTMNKSFWKYDQLNNPFLFISMLIGIGLQIFATTNFFMTRLLSTTPLTLTSWIAIVSVGFIQLLLLEFIKDYLLSKKQSHQVNIVQ